MIKSDELAFWQLVLRHCTVQPGPHTGITPRDLINSDLTDVPAKRAWYLLGKWSNQDLYDYGTTVDLGWVPSCCRNCGRFNTENDDAHTPTCPAPSYGTSDAGAPHLANGSLLRSMIRDGVVPPAPSQAVEDYEDALAELLVTGTCERHGIRVTLGQP